MVIGVEITQAHPFASGHCAQVWVTGPRETLGSLYEAIDSVSKFCEVLLELNWTSTASLLIDFWNGFEPFRPLNRN